MKDEYSAKGEELILDPINEDQLKEEVRRLPEDRKLQENNEYAVFVAEAGQIPALLVEIGRLREITFREVGEGTGRSIDLDPFDDYYLHLFLWNKKKEELAGAYRLGMSDEIIADRGVQGLYMSTLFDFDEEVSRILGRGIEVGRSFIRNEYQKQYSSLLLLWKGIGGVVLRNPRYRYLFGPVTISSAYSLYSRQLIISFLSLFHFDPALAGHVRPYTPFGTSPSERQSSLKEAGRLKDLDELSSLVASRDAEGKDIPILIRQYIRLGGKLLGFNVDSSFSDSLDGFILVDLLTCEKRLLAHYMGSTGAESFLAHHAAGARATRGG